MASLSRVGLFAFVMCFALRSALANDKPIEIQGNVVLPKGVYHTVLDLQLDQRRAMTSTRTSTVTGKRRAPRMLDTVVIEEQLTVFLHESGYLLASVRAKDAGDRIIVTIDEGKLDRIVFLNQSTLDLFRLKLAFELPGNVFNRDLLEQNIAALRASKNIRHAQYEIVPVTNVENPTLQIARPEDVFLGLRLFGPGHPHELRIRLITEGWQRGLSVGFGYRPPDGLYARAGYRLRDFLVARDGVALSSRVAIRIIDAVLRNEGSRFGLSEAGVALRYSSPSFLGGFLRVFSEISAKLRGLRRDDLMLDSYLFAPLDVSLNFMVPLSEDTGISAGIGAEQRFLFGLATRIDTDPSVDATPRSQDFMFVIGRLEGLFNPGELRRDRAHELTLMVRHFFELVDEPSSMTETHLRYQTMWSLGWDEIWLRLNATLLRGDIPFYMEVPLGGDFLHGVFSDRFFRRVGALQLEYRLSLVRDLFKLGIYNDLAFYNSLGANRRNQGLGVVDAFGGSLHAMVIDALQLSLYIGVGVDDDAESSIGASLSIEQAF